MKLFSVESNNIIGHDVPLSYPNISEILIIHIDNIKMHLGILINGIWELH